MRDVFFLYCKNTKMCTGARSLHTPVSGVKNRKYKLLSHQ